MNGKKIVGFQCYDYKTENGAIGCIKLSLEYDYPDSNLSFGKKVEEINLSRAKFDNFFSNKNPREVLGTSIEIFYNKFRKIEMIQIVK